MTRPIDQFDLIAFDADDTLWRSEDSFDAAHKRYKQIVQPHAPTGIDVLDALHAIEKADLSISGYGVKAFTISMVRAAISVTNGNVPSDVLGELTDIGFGMLTEPVQLLPDVPEVLEIVGAAKPLVLITKGDLVHQTRKVTTSGLEHHFGEVEIVLEKDPATYAHIFERMNVTPERVCMVGNSVRSDILPVMALGGHAVHIPYHLTWELERVDDHDEDVTELAGISELPAWLGL